MTVPILRDVALALPRNDAEVLAGRTPLVSAWVGRAGAAATVRYTVTELLPGGTDGTSAGASLLADPGAVGYYTRAIGTLTPGRQYRLTVIATDPGVPADETSQVFAFTNTPGPATP